MKNNHLHLNIMFYLGMILVLSACSLSSSGSLEEQTPVPEMTATTPPSATEEISDPEVGLSLEPNPASIEVSLEEGGAVTETIGLEGGSFKAMDSQGTEYTVTIPEGALFSETEITMIPIASAEGEYIGDTFLAGVALYPENLHFLEFVTIEMRGDVIEEDVIGFASVRDGQDFHLTPSQVASGVVTITTTHFSEFGVSQQEIVELAEMILPVAMEQALAIGDDRQAMIALEHMINELLIAGHIENFEQWEPWTADVIRLILRFEEIVEQRDWDENTPGLTDTMRAMQGLIDRWFQQSDGVMQDFADKCVQGEIEVAPRVHWIWAVGVILWDRLSLDRDEVLDNWLEILRNCAGNTITWQANVVTTGDDFFSDISVGSQVSFDFDGWLGRHLRGTELEVEYIEGAFADICESKPGVVDLGYEIQWDGKSEIYSVYENIDSIILHVSIGGPVYIDCAPAGFEITAEAQRPFHGGALELLNEDRVGQWGTWEFEVEYDPGSGIIAQFEEGPESFSWSEGKYELWQLLTMYQGDSSQ